MNHQFKGYTTASSRFVNNSYNGVTIQQVLRRNSGGLYIALCTYPGSTTPRVVNYNHVVQAAQGSTNLRHKYVEAKTPAAFGLIEANIATAVGVAVAKPAQTLVNAIKASPVAAKDFDIDLSKIDVATTLAVMNKLVAAAQKNADVRQLIKLVANTL